MLFQTPTLVSSLIILSSLLCPTEAAFGGRFLDRRRHHKRGLDLANTNDDIRVVNERGVAVTYTKTITTDITLTQTFWTVVTVNAAVQTPVMSTVVPSSSARNSTSPTGSGLASSSRVTASSSSLTTSQVSPSHGASSQGASSLPSASTTGFPSSSATLPHSSSTSVASSSVGSSSKAGSPSSVSSASSNHPSSSSAASSSVITSSAKSGGTASATGVHPITYPINSTTLSSSSRASSASSSSVISVTSSKAANSLNATTAAATLQASSSLRPTASASRSAVISSGSMMANASATATTHSSAVSSQTSVAILTSSMTKNATISSTHVSTSTPSPSSTSASKSASITQSSSSTKPLVSSLKTVSTTASSTSSSLSKSSSSSSSAASATASSSGGAGRTTRQLNNQIMASYYPDWSVGVLPPSSIDWNRFDVVDFAFAIPTSTYDLVFTQDSSESSLYAVVAGGHAAGKLVRLSIGGWTGSVYFSAATSTARNRKTFANNILKIYNQFNLDGIDIDWEYPGIQGAGNNGVSASDSANFLLFLQVLRQTLPADAVISAATQVWPFADKSGYPMTDVSGFANVLDWVLVMNYDVWGSSSTPGPNAPLSDACGNSTQPLANAYAAVSSWSSAGMSSEQILLGVPAYGYLQISSVDSLIQRRSTTLYNGNGGTTDGQIDFRSIVDQGALALDGSGVYEGSGGFEREWDECSNTPWLKSVATGQVVTYDDPESLSLKGQFARQAGLRGVNMWDMSGDDEIWSLTDALRAGLGL